MKGLDILLAAITTLCNQQMQWVSYAVRLLCSAARQLQRSAMQATAILLCKDGLLHGVLVLLVHQACAVSASG